MTLNHRQRGREYHDTAIHSGFYFTFSFPYINYLDYDLMNLLNITKIKVLVKDNL